MRIIILFLLAFGSLSLRSTAQTDAIKAEREIDQFIQARNWDQVMLRSLDLITQDPLQPQGYYYTALALCRQTEFSKAADNNKKAFLFGDEKWKNRSRELGKQIDELKKIIPQPVNLDDINSLEAYQWRELWEYDKTNTNAAINAIELYANKKQMVPAAEILDDPSISRIPGAKEYRKRLSGNKAVAGADKLESLIKTGDAHFAKKEYESALSAYTKALEMDKYNGQLSNKVDNAEDEIAWKTAQQKNTVEGYETYLNRSGYKRYQNQARAKTIDYLKSQIQRFAQRNEVDQAEAAYTKYVQRYRPTSLEKQELEKLLCELYSNAIYSLSGSKEIIDKKARLDLYYRARKICPLSEADKKEISKLEKSLN